MSDLALNASSPNALAGRDPSAIVPPIGDLDAYIRAVNRVPVLTPDQEMTFARRLRNEGDLVAAGRLIVSHLRLVVAISRKYRGYGLPQGDLIQEGNVGLMKAVKHFDFTKGVRLVTYATQWIKAEIHEYILKNWRIVKLATTKAQRKLFFNLRSLKQSLKDSESNHDRHLSTLTSREVESLSQALDVKPEDVLEMEARLSGSDLALEPDLEDGEAGYAPIAYLADDATEPTRVMESTKQEWLAADGLALALDALDARSRRIVEERWLNVEDDGSGGMTLHELAEEYGVSAERIRQIEVAAMRKLRKALECHLG